MRRAADRLLGPLPSFTTDPQNKKGDDKQDEEHDLCLVGDRVGQEEERHTGGDIGDETPHAGF